MSHCSPARGCLLNITWTRFPPPHMQHWALGQFWSWDLMLSGDRTIYSQTRGVRRPMMWGVIKHWSIVRDTWQVWCCWASHMLRPTVFVTEGGHFVAGEWRHTRWPPAATTVRAQCRIKLQECGWQKLGRLAVKHPAENKMSRATKGCDV